MIAAVVVTYSAPGDVLDRCLDSLRDAGGLDLVVVVDTGDRSELAERQGVELLRMPNRGYGAAANLGVTAAIRSGATAVALLNDDLVVRDGWLAPLVAELEPGVGAVQPIVLDGAGAKIGSLGVEIGRDGAGVDVGRDAPLLVTGPRDIELFTGGAVLLAAHFVRATGGFDERFFLYYEDVDLGRRGAALGWRYRLAPGSRVEHAGGMSTSAMPDRTRYLQERNRLWCAARHADAATIGRALWLSVRRLRFAPRTVHARALGAGLAGVPARLVERVRHRDVVTGTPISALDGP